MNNPSDRKHLPITQDPELYARLKAEAAAPYRGLRQVIYLACGGSGAIGAVVFLAQLLAGRDVNTAFPNFALQLGVIALMIMLFRWENRNRNRKSQP
jgi:Low psii accumulation1 / Rep27